MAAGQDSVPDDPTPKAPSLSDSQSDGDRTLRIAVAEIPGGLHPLLDGQGVTSYIGWMMLRPITAYDGEWRLVCGLCTELPSRRNGRIRDVTLPDGRAAVAVRFTLQRDARWGDGTPVSSRDVVFAWEIGRHADVGVSNRDFFAKDVLSVEAVDDKTFIVYRAKDTCRPEDMGVTVPAPVHVDREIFIRDPAAFRVHCTYESKPDNPGIWHGPYRLVEKRPDGVTLERNPSWYGTPPWFDRIIVRYSDSSADMAEALLSGAVDYVAGEYGFTVHQAAQLERQVGDRFTVLWEPGLAFRHLDLDHDHPALRDVRVRRALLHALDRDRINDRLFGGRHIVAHTDVHPMDTVHEEEVMRHPYDPADAARLLEEAGWSLGSDGLRRNGEGEVLELPLWAGAGDRTIELEQQFIQDSWRRIGVRADLRQAPARILFGEVLTERRFGGAALFSWISLPRTPADTVLHSAQIPTPANGWTGQNYMAYRNPRMDAILDGIDTACEPAANRRLWAEMQRIYAEDLPALPLFFMSQPYFLPRWLTGVEPTGHQFESTLRIEHWRRVDPDIPPVVGQ
ncbi:MAG: hypothetical protein RLY86_4237 [Pseudomonadota bacterium]